MNDVLLHFCIVVVAVAVAVWVFVFFVVFTCSFEHVTAHKMKMNMTEEHHAQIGHWSKRINGYLHR